MIPPHLTPPVDWDDAFANMAHIPGSERFPDEWARDAAAFRQTARARRDLPYGPDPRHRFDLFLPEGKPKGLMVFIHGGYWLRTSKDDWSHLAAGGVAHGFAVCLPSYRLTPTARIAEITQDVQKALVAAAQEVEGPIVIAGHSAGGHLAARLACADIDLPPAVQSRIRHILPISGVFDLRPLLRTAMNETLLLDPQEARDESPLLRDPKVACPLSIWVGADERPEFVRQSRLLAEVWAGLDQPLSLTIEEGRHHFDILDGLVAPDGTLLQRLLAPALTGS